jgi:hypothetical protein
MTPLSWWSGLLPLRLLGAGLAAPWALGVLVGVGHVVSGVSGPCTVAALLLAALAALLAGEFFPPLFYSPPLLRTN